VARRGEAADGHDHVGAAGAQGAVAALVSHPVDAPGLAQIQVKDTQLAFGRLARAVIDAGKPQLRVVAITGSSGKTSTKDLLAHVLGGWRPTVAAPESYNSEIGVPLTVCMATPDTRLLVVEMGARGAGHLSYLTTIAPPDIAIVLNVGHAHAGEFGSLDGVEAAKGELAAAVGPDGIVVLNLDDDRVARMRGRCRGGVVGVSTRAHPDAAVQAAGITIDAEGRARFTLSTHAAAWPRGAEPLGGDAAVHVQLRLRGAHHVDNALSATAAALTTGMPLPEVAAALASATPASRWRMEVTDRADGVRVVNDAYNANPDSVAAALRAVAAMTRGRRSWAVLGEMLELGPDSVRLHEQTGALATTLGIDRVLAVGAGAAPVAHGAITGAAASSHTKVDWAPDVEAAFGVLGRELEPGDIVLFKSSRDAGLRWLGDRIATG
jgi:UDP-N-acetylmuramoyl-tripeptide--D-alanyl-D-alanine ligase